MIRKLFSFALVLLLLFGLAACGESGGQVDGEGYMKLELSVKSGEKSEMYKFTYNTEE